MGKEKESYQIKNIITGYIFELTKAECDKLVKEEPHNFAVVDKDYVSPIPEPEKTSTVYDELIGDNSGEDKENATVKGLEEYSYAELKAYAKEHGLDASGRTEVLRERCIAHSKEEAEVQLHAEPQEGVTRVEISVDNSGEDEQG